LALDILATCIADDVHTEHGEHRWSKNLYS
jgi:hypothetical protein